jgi:methionyl-tRNA formyltransferase
MKILFWGTPDYAVPTLEALIESGHTIVGVVTQPDRRRGRGKQLIPSPVKARALDLGCPVFTPERIRKDIEVQQTLKQLNADVSVVVAFGQILPKSVLQQPPLGCWNGHGSLLPRWRGAGPIQWSLLEGDSETGVGIMAMEEGLDTGPVLIEQPLAIGLSDNAEQLSQKLSQLTGQLMVNTYTHWQGKRLKLRNTEPLIHRLRDQLSTEAQALIGRWPTAGHPAGTVLSCEQNIGLVVSTTGCPLLIRSAQLEGKGTSEGSTMLQQLQASDGMTLG